MTTEPDALPIIPGKPGHSIVIESVLPLCWRYVPDPPLAAPRGADPLEMRCIAYSEEGQTESGRFRHSICLQLVRPDGTMDLMDEPHVCLAEAYGATREEARQRAEEIATAYNGRAVHQVEIDRLRAELVKAGLALSEQVVLWHQVAARSEHAEAENVRLTQERDAAVSERASAVRQFRQAERDCQQFMAEVQRLTTASTALQGQIQALIAELRQDATEWREYAMSKQKQPFEAGTCCGLADAQEQVANKLASLLAAATEKNV